MSGLDNIKSIRGYIDTGGGNKKKVNTNENR